MPSSNQNHAKTNGLNLIFFSIPQNTLLQLSTGPVLMAVLAGKVANDTFQAIGQASEEVFRGDRLPILKFPVKTEPESS